MTVYEKWQSEKYGNIIPETPDTTCDSKDWFEREMEIQEYLEQEN